MQKHIPQPKQRMVRKQFYITAEQDRQLKEVAKAERVPAADIVRRGLQHAIEQSGEAERLANLKVDFEIEDALAKLVRLRLVSKNENRYVALPIDKALENLDHAWDNYFQYNQVLEAAAS